MSLKRGIDGVVTAIVAELAKMVLLVDSRRRSPRVTISANSPCDWRHHCRLMDKVWQRRHDHR